MSFPLARTRAAFALAVLAALLALAALPGAAAASVTSPAACLSALEAGSAPARAMPGSASGALLASHSVLRRNATASDRAPFLQALPDELGQFDVTRYDPAHIRALLTGADGAIYLVPATLAAEHFPAACAGLGAGLRSLYQYGAEVSGSGPGACLISAKASGAIADVACASNRVFGSYLATSNDVLTPAGEPVFLVPDGIAAVRYTFAGRPAQTAVADGNLAAVPARPGPFDAATTTASQVVAALAAALPTSVTLLRASGAVAATQPRPANLLQNLQGLYGLLLPSWRPGPGSAH